MFLDIWINIGDTTFLSMKKYIAVIGGLVLLLPMGKPLVMGTGMFLTSAAVMLSVPEKVQAESASFYYKRGIEKYKAGVYYGAISDYSKAIEINPRDSNAYNNRARTKYMLGDMKGSCTDAKKAASLGDVESKRILRGSLGAMICGSSRN